MSVSDEVVDKKETFGQDESADANSPFWIGVPRVTGKISLLLYGPSGSGKTVMASTFPKPVFLDFERGMASVTRAVGRVPKDRDKKLETWDELVQACRILKEGKHPFETVVLDSGNEMHAMISRHVVDKFPVGPQKRNFGDVPAMADYQKINRDFARIIRGLLELPYHIVVTCASTTRDKDTDLVQPELPGKLKADIVRFFDMVGTMVVRSKQEVEGGEIKRSYGVSFSYSELYVTKDRFGTMPPLIRADYAEIQKYVIERASNGKAS